MNTQTQSATWRQEVTEYRKEFKTWTTEDLEDSYAECQWEKHAILDYQYTPFEEALEEELYAREQHRQPWPIR